MSAPDLLYSLGEEAESLASALNVCVHLSTPFVVPGGPGQSARKGAAGGEKSTRGVDRTGGEGQFYDATSPQTVLEVSRDVPVGNGETTSDDPGRACWGIRQRFYRLPFKTHATDSRETQKQQEAAHHRNHALYPPPQERQKTKGL